MIVKRIPASPLYNHRRVHSAQARDLVNYLAAPEKESEYKDYLVQYLTSQGYRDGPERLLHLGSMNFVSDTFTGQRAEMMATAQAAVRSRNPIDHWLLSWSEGEHPSADQIDGAVSLFLKEIGMSQHQCIYAAHGDTHNVHVHIALNRYDPFAKQTQKIEGGWYKEAAHRAVAKIVSAHGWKAAENARYEVVDGRSQITAKAKQERKARQDGDIAHGLSNVALGVEQRTGYRSAQRIAQEIALPIILGTKSWTELHGNLASEGIAYQLSGTNGAVIVVGDQHVKSSTVSRAITPTKLIEKLGPFQASRATVLGRDRSADRLPWAFRAEEHLEAKRQWQSLDASQRKALGLRRPATDLEAYLHRIKEVFFAERLRNRSCDFNDMDGIEGDGSKAVVRRPIDGYMPTRCSDGVRYARKDEATAFLDLGNRVVVVPGSDEALLAALRLSIEKFGKVRLRGSREFRDRVTRLALDHGLEDRLKNPTAVPTVKARRSIAASANPAGVADLSASKSTDTNQTSPSAHKEAKTRAGQGPDHPHRGEFAAEPATIGRTDHPVDTPSAQHPPSGNDEQPTFSAALSVDSDRYDLSAAKAAYDADRARSIKEFRDRFTNAFAGRALPFAFKDGRATVVDEAIDAVMGEGSATFASAMGKDVSNFFQEALSRARDDIRDIARERRHTVIVSSPEGTLRWDWAIFGDHKALAVQLIKNDPEMAGLGAEILAATQPVARTQPAKARPEPVRRVETELPAKEIDEPARDAVQYAASKRGAER